MAENVIPKMSLASEDLVGDRLCKLRELMPECFTESGIDFEKLRLELGDEVDEGQERYAFTWPGKMDAIRQSQTTSTATLRPCVEKSRGRDGVDGSFDSDNIYIEGDNLEVLKLLQRGYAGKVKMIYIDPPYNTGHDFVYKDKFGDTIENYKEQAGLAGQSNADTSGRYHSDWCSMMYPRLKLARELLSEDGVIFISIDDNEDRNLRIICDEVFGENNFLASFVWEKKYTRANDAQYYSANHDYLLAYARSINSFTAGRLPRTDEMNAAYRNPDNDPRGPWKATPLHARSGSASSVYAHIFSNGTAWTPPSGTFPRYSESRLEEMERNGELWFGKDGNAVPSRKTYLSSLDGKGIVATTIIPHELGGHNHEAEDELKDLFDGSMIFTSPKPVKLIKLTIQLANVQPNDIVLDFFSGSATSAEAVIRKNIEDGGYRQFILVQIPEKAGGEWDTLCDIGEERIRRAGDKIKAEVEEANAQPRLNEEPKKLPDIGFRVFTLDDSGIQKPDPGVLLRDVVKPDRSDLDIVFEMMLKWGLELTLPIEKEEFAGYPAYSVAAGELVCCLAPGLTMEALEVVANECPRRVLILDSILSDSLKLNALQLFRAAGERHGEEIELRTV